MECRALFVFFSCKTEQRPGRVEASKCSSREFVQIFVEVVGLDVVFVLRIVHLNLSTFTSDSFTFASSSGGSCLFRRGLLRSG